MKVAVIKYNAGNVKSVEFALNRLNINPIITNDREDILSADRVIFPGVGEASSTMYFLEKLNLSDIIKEIKSPFLGICLGMQLMCEFSMEGETDCIGIFPLRVKKFQNKELKVPHMGWNSIESDDSGLFKGLRGEHFYFVHSYYVPESSFTIGKCSYGLDFSAAIQKENYSAVQFHPEKSGEAGAKLLQNFLEND